MKTARASTSKLRIVLCSTALILLWVFPLSGQQTSPQPQDQEPDQGTEAPKPKSDPKHYLLVVTVLANDPERLLYFSTGKAPKAKLPLTRMVLAPLMVTAPAARAALVGLPVNPYEKSRAVAPPPPKVRLPMVVLLLTELAEMPNLAPSATRTLPPP